jgi:hypothetical protein
MDIDYRSLHAFSCRAFALAPKSRRRKWDRKATPAIFLGTQGEHAYKLLDESNQSIFISSDVTFDNSCFPLSTPVKEDEKTATLFLDTPPQRGDRCANTIVQRSEVEIKADTHH